MLTNYCFIAPILLEGVELMRKGKENIVNNIEARRRDLEL